MHRDEIAFDDIQYIGEFSLQQTLKGEALLASAEPNNLTEALLVFKHVSATANPPAPALE